MHALGNMLNRTMGREISPVTSSLTQKKERSITRQAAHLQQACKPYHRYQ